MLLIFRSLIIIFIYAIVSACSVKEIKTDSGLLNEGQKNFAKRRFDKSEELFKKILDDYPDSKLRTYALMGFADSLYKSDKLQEASFQYKEFSELYPVHGDIIKARFYKGMSEFNERKPADRDQSFTRNAIEEFKKITSNEDYMNSPFYEESKKKIEVCRKTLAENVFFVGKFYFRTKSYQSVINRMHDLLNDYPGETYEDEAIYYLAESYYREDSFRKALVEFNKLMEKFPQSIYVNIARSRISGMESMGYIK